ncbi:MAG: phage Gp37/Gp68 family protein [Myxococcota bacterium]
MADATAIEWTDATWNPVSGCSKVSRGCDRCYAERFSERFRGVSGHAFEQGFDLRLWPQRLMQPTRWKRSRRVFVNSMGDLFHKNIPRKFVSDVFDVMEYANWHQYQVLTKRSSLLRCFVNSRFPSLSCPDHIWLGVSVEDRRALRRIEHLQRANASIRFLSVEPLLESLGEIDLTGIHWVIVGGESGPGFRAMDPTWVREVRDQCVDQCVPFFFKQWGGVRPKSGGNLLDGEQWLQYPSQSPPQLREASLLAVQSSR